MRASNGEIMLFAFSNAILHMMNGKQKKEGLIDAVIRPLRDDKEGDDWIEVGQVDELLIYPLKSGKAVDVDEAIVGHLGLMDVNERWMRDRSFVVVDHRGKVLTGRVYPKLVLVLINIENDIVTFKAPEMEDIQVNLNDKFERKVETFVWSDSCSGLDLGEEAGKWITDYLGLESQCKILWHKDVDTSRPLNSRAKGSMTPNVDEKDVALFGDGFGFLLLSTESVDGLKDRVQGLDIDLTPRRFRPNIVVKNTQGPHSEDSWSRIKIGDVQFRGSSLCTRCIFTTVDPESGEKDKRTEPLKTMRKYRTALDPKQKKYFGQANPFFGVNLGLIEEAEGKIIKRGDSVFAKYTL